MKTSLLSIFILLSAALFYLGCSTDADTTPEPVTGKSSILAQVNDLRRSGCQCGEEFMPPVPALDWNELLESAALRHAKDMAANDHFDHTGTDGSSTSSRLEAEGYNWAAYGENIAYGFTSADSVIQMWQESEQHCRNLMNSNFTEMGVAQENGYWVQVLGTSR